MAGATSMKYVARLSGCNCEDESWFAYENILQFQMASDFLIAAAYFSMPLELLYFLSFSRVFPFRWILILFAAFILLCGFTHFMTIWTYGPQSIHVRVVLTIFKALTALVACATSITLATLIPKLLSVKVREVLLTKKAMELDREVSLMKIQEQQERHIDMVTREIRKSLDRHTILSTTLIELSKALGLENCTIWVPGEDEVNMELTHEYKQRYLQSRVTVPKIDPDVEMIKSDNMATVLRPNSPLGQTSSDDDSFHGSMAAIRVPLFKPEANFKGGAPQFLEASYAILVLILPSQDKRIWTPDELRTVVVVADQLAVALSHAAMMEELQQTRDRLTNQNKTLQRARQDAMMASQARHLFRVVMNHEMRTPLHSISAASSLLRARSGSSEQQVIVNMLVRNCNLLSVFLNDTMDWSHLEDAHLVLELHPFRLPLMLKEAENLSKHMYATKGRHFVFELSDAMPDNVIGDEKRVLEILLHTVGNTIKSTKKGTISVHVCVVDKSAGIWDLNNPPWRPSFCEGFIYLRFEIKSSDSGADGIDILRLEKDFGQDTSHSPKYNEASLGFAKCRKYVQLMHGNIWSEQTSQGVGSVVTFLVRLQLQTSTTSNQRSHTDESNSKSSLKDLNVLIVDDNDVNCKVTNKLLETLGCQTTVANSGYQCLKMLFQPESAFQVVLLDVCMPGMDGYEVTFHILQKVPPEKQPLVVALTASTDKATWSRCLHMGMAGVITKPVSLESMRDQLLKIIQQHSNHTSENR